MKTDIRAVQKLSSATNTKELYFYFVYKPINKTIVIFIATDLFIISMLNSRISIRYGKLVTKHLILFVSISIFTFNSLIYAFFIKYTICIYLYLVFKKNINFK